MRYSIEIKLFREIHRVTDHDVCNSSLNQGNGSSARNTVAGIFRALTSCIVVNVVHAIQIMLGDVINQRIFVLRQNGTAVCSRYFSFKH